MAADVIRVGMIGCGGNARSHMGRLLKMEGVQIVGLCDPAEGALAAAVEAHPALAKVPRFADYRELLGGVELDAVEISTPHTSHYEQIMAALDRGLHVLTEKPMVCDVAHAVDVIARAKETGLVVGVSYQRHTQAPYRYCKEVIASGEAGKVNYISCLQSQNWYRGQVPRGTWRSKLALSGGGQLNDSGSHLLDIILWMTDLQPAEVFAFIDNMGSEVDILTSMSVKFAGGALGSFSVVGHAVGGMLEDITIWCEDGTLAIRGGEVQRWQGNERTVISGEALGRTWSPDDNFFAAIRNQEAIQTPPECGLRVIQLTEAAWRSGRTGQPAGVLS